MKKYNKYLIMLLGAMSFLACTDPLEDEVELIREDAPVKTFSYSLTEVNYGTIADNIKASATTEQDSTNADWIESNLAFSNTLQAADFVPEFLGDEYPYFGKGSAIVVSYNKYEGDNADFDIYNSASRYKFSDEDYFLASNEAGELGFMNNSIDVDAQAVRALNTNIQDPNDGDVVFVNYQFLDLGYDDIPAGAEVLGVTFESDLENFTSISVSGDQAWEWDSRDPDAFAIMSGFSGGSQPNVDWMVSPEIDLSEGDGADISISITQRINFLSDGVVGEDIRILVSDDYTGDVATANWVDLDLESWPEGNSWDFEVNNGDFSDFGGDKVHLAFKYISTSDYAPNWAVDAISILVGQVPESESHNVYYEFDGEWEAARGVYALSSADYDMMGAPGRFDNFSDSEAPANYLPSFMGMKYPFAQEGDQMTIIYRYFSGGTSTLSEVYTFSNGVWGGNLYSSTSEQYINNGTVWVFDPSVVLTMTGADFQHIVEFAKVEHAELVNDFGSGEDYYGADAFFVNFDIRSGSKSDQSEYNGLSADDTEALALERAGEGVVVFLESAYPDQPTQVNGVDVFYTVFADTYNGEDGVIMTYLQVTGTGEFTILEGPTFQ
jgi:hypothetical protein